MAPKNPSTGLINSEILTVDNTVNAVLNPRVRQDEHIFGDVVFKPKEIVELSAEDFEKAQEHKTYQDGDWLTTVTKAPGKE